MYIEKDKLVYDTFFQGDIIEGFPFFILDGDSLKQEGLDQFSSDEKQINIKAVSSKVIILSQTCDLQRRENVLIAPVYTIQSYEDSGALKTSEVGLIKKRRIGYWFYLPMYDGVIDDSLADFQTIHYIPRVLLEGYKSKKLVSLSDWGRHHLGWALCNYLGRPIEDKHN